MANAMAPLVILLVTMTVVNCQTFQYSRGWTTGKRADHGMGLGVDGVVPSEFNINLPAQGAIRRANDPETIHCGLRKLRMLLRGNTNEQLYHLPCELLTILSNEVEINQQVPHKESRRTSDILDALHYDNRN